MNQYIRLHRDVGKNYITLPQKKQLKLLKKYQETKEEKYLVQIIKANLRLIIDVANSFNRYGQYDSILMDLISVGNEEAIRCLDRYDFNKGNCTVSSWIRNNITLKIILYLKEYGVIVKVNSSAYDKISNDKKHRNTFFLKNGYYPNKGETINIDGEPIKFKNEYELSTFDGFESNGEKSFFENMEDEASSNEFEFLTKREIVALKINEIAGKSLDRRSHEIINLHYNKNVKLTDVNKYLTVENDREFRNLLKTGKSNLKIFINGKKYIYNIYCSFHFNEKNTAELDKGREYELDGILKYENIYINNNSFNLFFNQNENVDIQLNKQYIPSVVSDEFSNKKIFKIFISKKIGVPISKMHTYNLHERAIQKLRRFVLKKKINIYE